MSVLDPSESNADDDRAEGEEGDDKGLKQKKGISRAGCNGCNLWQLVDAEGGDTSANPDLSGQGISIWMIRGITYACGRWQRRPGVG